MPCRSFLSLKNSLPGPQVGKDAKEQTIFPPVALKADTADSSVGNKAGSGFFTCENSLGNCARRDVMTDLVNQHYFILAKIPRWKHTLICTDRQKAHRFPAGRMDLRYLT